MYKLILAVSGSGKSDFVKIWGSSCPGLIDADKTKEMTGIYKSMVERFGPQWWKDPKHDEPMNVLVGAAASSFDMYPTTGIGAPIFLSAERRLVYDARVSCLVEIDWANHRAYIAQRRLKQGVNDIPQPTPDDAALSDWRGYYRMIAEKLQMPVFHSFTDAYWYCRRTGNSAEQIAQTQQLAAKALQGQA